MMWGVGGCRRPLHTDNRVERFCCIGEIHVKTRLLWSCDPGEPVKATGKHRRRSEPTGFPAFPGRFCPGLTGLAQTLIGCSYLNLINKQRGDPSETEELAGRLHNWDGNDGSQTEQLKLLSNFMLFHKKTLRCGLDHLWPSSLVSQDTHLHLKQHLLCLTLMSVENVASQSQKYI